MAENKSTISQKDSYGAIGEFSDTNDFTEFDDPQRPDVAFEIHDGVRIEAGLLSALEKEAAARGVSTETMVNLWLLEKVESITAPGG